MPGGLDFASLYAQSGPALLGVLNVLVIVVWVDFRDKIDQAKTKAADAVSEAEAAAVAAREASATNNRQEMLIDQVATDIDDLEEAVRRNDQRIRKLQTKQAAAHGDDFTRGGSPGKDDVEPTAETKGGN